MISLARAAAIASRTRAGAVPPKLMRLATDAGEQRTLGAQVARLEAMQSVAAN